MNELLSCFLGQGGRCPRTPFPTLLGESSAICTCPLVLDPKLRHRLQDFGGRPTSDRESIADVVNFNPLIAYRPLPMIYFSE